MNFRRVAIKNHPTASRCQRKGFTLMEVMVAMAVFTTIALSVTSTVIQGRRLSQLNVLRNAAYTVAQGYMEQMMSLTDASLEAASEPWVSSKPPIPTESVNSLVTNSTAIETSDPLYVSTINNGTITTNTSTAANMTARTDAGYTKEYWNYKSIMVDLNTTAGGTSTAINMNMWVDVTVSRNWTQDVNGNWQVPSTPYFLVRIDFKFQAPGYLAVGKLGGTLRMVINNIPGA